MVISEASTPDRVSGILQPRTCGKCGVRDIPRGIPWSYWEDGQCVHFECVTNSRTLMLALALTAHERNR